MSGEESEGKGNPWLGLDEGWKTRWKKRLRHPNATGHSSGEIELKAELNLENNEKIPSDSESHGTEVYASQTTSNINEITKERQYQTVYEKNYISNYTRENPLSEIFTVFKESVLQYEKQKFHQEILNKVIEISNYIKKSEKVEEKYIEYLRKAANLEVFTCRKCEYQTIHKTNLKTHLFLIHQKDLETKMFQCLLCPYTVRNLTYLKKHQLVHSIVETKIAKTESDSSKNHLECHKDPEKQQRNYMCEICSCRLKTKAGLEFHILRHKPMDQVKEIFRCLHCKYQTKFKSNLKIHMEVHQAPSFVCDVCGFQSRRKWNHEMHLLTHKSENEVTIYKCAMCSYKTKFKDRLKKHLALGTHLGTVRMARKQVRQSSTPSKVNKKVLKCSVCEFETSSRKDYCKHVVKHKSEGASVEKTYCCEFCSFETFYSSSFSTHLNSHKSLDEIERFQSPKCSFKTRLKGNLKKHINIHKDPSELETFKCDICGTTLTRKENLTVHMLLHKSPEEVEILKCSLCSYQSKIRAYMQVHLKKTHKIVTRRNEYRKHCTIVNPKTTLTG